MTRINVPTQIYDDTPLVKYKQLKSITINNIKYDIAKVTYKKSVYWNTLYTEHRVYAGINSKPVMYDFTKEALIKELKKLK